MSSGNWFDWVRIIIDFLDENDSILEVGFGTGVLQEALIQRGYHSFGIDESRQMVRISNKRLRKFKNKINIVRGNALRMPFQDHHFDKVISTFPADFITQKRFLNELDRILLPNGTFIALIGVKFNRINLVDWFYRFIFRATGQQIPPDIEENFSKKMSKFHDFSYEVVWKNYEERSLCFIIFKRF